MLIPTKVRKLFQTYNICVVRIKQIIAYYLANLVRLKENLIRCKVTGNLTFHVTCVGYKFAFVVGFAVHFQRVDKRVVLVFYWRCLLVYVAKVFVANLNYVAL